MFDKYRAHGAYHWRQLNPLNFRLYNPRLLARYQAVVRVVQRRLELNHARGLDIGCGDGALYGRLVRLGATMAGIDCEPAGLHVAQDALSRPLLALASAYALPFACNTFDFAVMSELVEHLETPSLCMAEAARVLKRGGILVVTTPHRDPSGQLHSSHHVREFDGEELNNLLRTHLHNITVLAMHPARLTRCYTGKGIRARLLRWMVKVLAIIGFNPFSRCGFLDVREPQSNDDKGTWDHLIAAGEVR